MKSITLSIMLLCSVQAISQHDYFPMDSVNSWKYNVGSFAGSEEFWLEELGDTLINGQDYRIIGDRSWGYNIGRYLREDIAERKVYVYSTNSA